MADLTPDLDAIRERHVVMWSGGITSWEVARRVVAEHGQESTVLLFADTNAEDPDLYRWNREATAALGMPLTVVADGRTPWQVFRDERFLGNARVAPCSHLLKQKPCREWLKANTDPESTVLYVGIDWSETHRLPAIVRGWAPWTVRAPLTEPPYTDKRDLVEGARTVGLEPPRMYAEGFPHNNCAGACVRGGQAQWLRLLTVHPGRYADAEAHEESLRSDLGDVAILRDRTGGTTRPLTLAALRERAESAPDTLDGLDWGACGCFTEEAA